MRTGDALFRRMSLQRLRPLSSRIFTAGSILLLWEAAGRILEIRPEILPTPTRIAAEISAQADRLRSHTLISGAEIVGGYLLALACAVPLAFLLTTAPQAYRVGYPVLRFLRQAPMVILVPVIFIWFGFGVKPEIFIVFALCFVTITVGIVSGLRSVTGRMIDLLRLMGASDVQVLLKARIPASLPAALTGLKAAVPLAVMGATAGEFAQAEMGLGSLMLAGAFKRDTPMVFAALAILGSIGLSLNGLITLLEHLPGGRVETTPPAPR